MNEKILVVEDEENIRTNIKEYLENQHYQVLEAGDGELGLELVESMKPDLIILDLMLPKVDGMEVCKQVRRHHNTPIIMVTARNEEIDKLLGLELGADDYITKPFNILEVKARIKAIMRRTSPAKPKTVDDSVIEKGDLKLDCESRRLFILGNEINLTAREFELLELMVKNENKVYSRENLLTMVWGQDYPGDVRTVDVHVRRLREKIEVNPSEPKYVHTKWGVGYYYNQK